MKSTHGILLILIALLLVRDAHGISVEDFKKISSADERRTLIEQAPPEQKEELERIHLHMALLESYGSEAALRAEKERYAAEARGLTSMEGLFHVRLALWEQYMGGVVTESTKTGKPLDQRMVEELSSGEKAAQQRLSVVHSLVSEIAGSPAALDLEKRIEKLGKSLYDQFELAGWNGVAPMKPFVTKAQLQEIDKQIDQIFEEMKKLPKLTQEQAQKEAEEFPESKMHR